MFGCSLEVSVWVWFDDYRLDQCCLNGGYGGHCGCGYGLSGGHESLF